MNAPPTGDQWPGSGTAHTTWPNPSPDAAPDTYPEALGLPVIQENVPNVNNDDDWTSPVSAV